MQFIFIADLQEIVLLKFWIINLILPTNINYIKLYSLVPKQQYKWGLETVALFPFKTDSSQQGRQSDPLYSSHEGRAFLLVHLPKKTLWLGQKAECMLCV